MFSAGPLNQFGPTVVDDASGRVWVAWCGRNAGGVFVQRATSAGQPGSPSESTTIRLTASKAEYVDAGWRFAAGEQRRAGEERVGAALRRPGGAD